MMKIIRATITEDYYVDMFDDVKTKINGWTMEQVIVDWFKNHPMYSHHATRDGHIIGYSRKFINSEIIEQE